MTNSTALLSFLSKLERLSALNEADRQAVLALPYSTRRLDAGGFIVRDGDHSASCHVLVSGFVCRDKVTASGLRQILSFHLRGDCVDLQQVLMAGADCSVQALTRVQLAVLPKTAVAELIANHPNVADALWFDILLDASIQREWTANVGRRDARTRIAHVLCEFGLRMEACGLGTRTDYDFPITQGQLADAAGLTSVHVNRVLQSLRASGLISGKSPLKISDWDKMTEAADFNPSYLQPLAA